MRKSVLAVSALLALIALGAAAGAAAPPAAKASAPAGPEWKMNATVIEACSCTMFCPCYFNTSPSSHHEHGGAGEHFCRANNAYKINSGHYGDAKLDGAKFWIITDLGGDFSKGMMDWAILTFDKADTKEQRDGILQIASHLFPVQWKSFKTAEGDITWNYDGSGDAHALLDGGKTAEVHLKASPNANNPAEPVVIKNLRYWGATSNDGFVLMPNVIETYRVSDKAFEFKGTNGFMLTLDIDSKNAPPAAGASSF